MIKLKKAFFLFFMSAIFLLLVNLAINKTTPEQDIAVTMPSLPIDRSYLNKKTPQIADYQILNSNPLSDTSINPDFYKLRDICGDKEIVISQRNKLDRATKLTIIPDNINLPTIGSNTQFIDYSFSSDCKNIYLIAESGVKPIRDIFKYNLETRKYNQLTKNLDPRGPYLDIGLIPPFPIFIYPIDSNRLFISFVHVTTGMDAVVNINIDKIFDIPSQKFTRTIVNNEDDFNESTFSPELLNFKKSVLSYFIQVRSKDRLSANVVRRDFDLNTEKFSSDVEIMKDSSKYILPFFNGCTSEEEDSGKTYLECLQDDLNIIFP